MRRPSKTFHYFTFLGIIFLLLQSESSESDSVFQSPTVKEIQEGQSAVLDCSFTTFGSSPDLFWYRQYTGREPQRILRAFKSSQQKRFKEGKFSTTFFAENKSVPLEIEGVSLQDAAVYFCALSHESGWNKVIFGSGTKLGVLPDLPESEPSVYELEPHDKSKSLSACLFADYSPGEIEVSVDGGEPQSTNSSVVVVDGKASYGEVRWTENTENPKCTATYGGRTFSANNNATADVCSGTPVSFQTDERLNLLSLTVIGLRIIFFKSVAVNLLLTFRLWYIKN